ncbi:MAG: ATP synthase F1 subunit delta [Bacteroidetes bacterium]|nr:ATP synthase F1 subunit delta [Bacteroidota bacterium]
MEGTRAAVRYAKALKELALEQGLLEKVCDDMKLISSVCKNNHDFAVVLDSPIVKIDKKQAILKEIFQGKICKLTELFIHLLAAKRRESYIEAIAIEFVKQFKEHKKILTAIVTTASGLDESLRKKVMEVIKDGGQSEVELMEKINEKLIGGFTLQVGDKRIDASIAKQIRKLAMNFSENPYIKEY